MCILVASVDFGRNQCTSLALVPVHVFIKSTLIFLYLVLIVGENQSTYNKVRDYGCMFLPSEIFLWLLLN